MRIPIGCQHLAQLMVTFFVTVTASFCACATSLITEARWMLFPEFQPNCQSLLVGVSSRGGVNSIMTEEFPPIGPHFEKFSSFGLVTAEFSDAKLIAPMPGGGSPLNRFSFILDRLGIEMRLTDRVKNVEFLASDMVILLNPREIENMNWEKEIMLRINLRHAGDRAQNYLDYKRGIISPLIGGISTKSGEEVVSFEEFQALAGDIYDLARYLTSAIQFGAGTDQLIALNFNILEKIKLLRNAAEMTKEVFSRSRELKIEFDPRGKFARADDEPHPWLVAWYSRDGKQARVTFPVPLDLTYLIQGRVESFQLLNILQLKIDRWKVLVERTIKHLALIQDSLNADGIFNTNLNTSKKLEQQAQDLTAAVLR